MFVRPARLCTSLPVPVLTRNSPKWNPRQAGDQWESGTSELQTAAGQCEIHTTAAAELSAGQTHSLSSSHQTQLSHLEMSIGQLIMVVNRQDF